MKFNPGDLVEFTEPYYFLYLAGQKSVCVKTPKQLLSGDFKSAFGVYLCEATEKLLIDNNLKSIIRSNSHHYFHQILLFGKIYFAHKNSFKVVDI